MNPPQECHVIPFFYQITEMQKRTPPTNIVIGGGVNILLYIFENIDQQFPEFFNCCYTDSFVR